MLAGLLIGSFLNVCIFRLPRDLSVVSPARSFCPECETTIAWYDNIPVVSYLVLGARCRQCKAHIPVRYLLVEIATGVAFALCVGKLGLSLSALKYCIYSAIMIALIASDIEERILPDEFTLGGTVVGLAFAPFVPLEHYFAAMFIPYSWGDRPCGARRRRSWISASPRIPGETSPLAGARPAIPGSSALSAGSQGSIAASSGTARSRRSCTSASVSGW